MAFDPSQISLSPRGAKLRLPPKNLRKPTYEEVYQLVRRHLGEEESPPLTIYILGKRANRRAELAEEDHRRCNDRPTMP